MSTPRGLFIIMCIIVTLMVLGSLQYLEDSPGSHYSKTKQIIVALEQSNVVKYKNGIITMYPVVGSMYGGTQVTFVFAIQNDSVALNWPKSVTDYFGGCIVDGLWVPLANVERWDPSKVFLLSCILPAHPPGEVEISVIVENVTRYVYDGMARFTFLPPISDSTSDTALALCAVFKDQALYLREWITFHTIFGVTKFYLYDQGSTDNWEELIQDFIESNVVVPIRWSFEWFAPSIRHQPIAYWHAIKMFGNQTKWMGFIDIDEFLLMPKAHESSPNPSIVNFLEGFENFGGLMIDRVNFGPNGHDSRPPGLVIENYLKRADDNVLLANPQPVKSIVQPKYVKWAGCGGVHTFSLIEGFNNVDAIKNTREHCGIPVNGSVVWHPIHINHYFTKSVQDWADRLNRFDSNPYPITAETMLKKWDSLYNTKDSDILVYVNQTKRIMKKELL